MENNTQVNEARESRILDREVILINFLRQNARVKLKEISDRTKMPHATPHSILKRLNEKRDIIKKYTSIIDFSKIGFSIGCFFIARPASESKKEDINNAINLISKCRNINSIYLTTEKDIIVEAWFRSMAELVELRDMLSEFCSVREHEIIESLEQERFIL